MQIVIIGGGFSGLWSAYLLERVLGADADIVILERTGRLGGRICTYDLDDDGAYYDSGAAELYEIPGGYSLKVIARALGLETCDLSATPYFHFDGHLVRCEDDLQAVISRAGMNTLGRFWELGTSMRSPEQFAAAGHPADNDHPWSGRTFAETLDLIDHAQARRFTEAQVHSDVATEPGLTSGLYGFDNLLVDHPDYVQMCTVPGGNEQFIHALAENVSARIILEADVAGVVGRKGEPHEVVAFVDEIPRRLPADFVLVTPPPLYLEDINWAPAPLEAAVREHVRHHLYPADYLRVTIRTAERTWADELPEDYFVCSGLGGVTVYDKTISSGTSEVPLLSLLIAGRDAVELARRPDREVLSLALGALPPAAGVAKQSVTTCRVDRWTKELGVSCLPGGRPLLALSQRHEPCPACPGIFMLGDYLYDSTINGALDACVHVARTICERLAGRQVATLEELLVDASFLQIVPPARGHDRRSGRQVPFLARQVWCPSRSPV